MPVLDNAKHERFAQELAKGEAACTAYVTAGYKANDGNAIRLKGNERIASRVEEILSAVAERAEITQADVLRELGRIGFSDIRKLFGAGGALKRIEDLDDDAAACLASVEVVTRRVPGSDADEVEHVAKIKTWDKPAALVNIGKHLGMFKDAPAPVDLNVNLSLNDTDLARLIAFQLTKATKTD